MLLWLIIEALTYLIYFWPYLVLSFALFRYCKKKNNSNNANIFWAIHQELFFMSILTKNKSSNLWISFGKIVGLQHPNLLQWNSTISVFLGITDIIFWDIFGNSYHIKSFQIIDKSCLIPLMIFLNMANN